MPGELTNPNKPINTTVDNLIKTLNQVPNYKPPQTALHSKQNVYMPESIYNTTHVYIKVQDPKSLMPKFAGPFLIVNRPSRSTIEVKVGTYASGLDRIDTHHWNSCRPAFVGPNTPIR